MIQDHERNCLHQVCSRTTEEALGPLRLLLNTMGDEAKLEQDKVSYFVLHVVDILGYFHTPNFVIPFSYSLFAPFDFRPLLFSAPHIFGYPSPIRPFLFSVTLAKKLILHLYFSYFTFISLGFATRNMHENHSSSHNSMIRYTNIVYDRRTEGRG